MYLPSLEIFQHVHPYYKTKLYLEVHRYYKNGNKNRITPIDEQ